MSNSAAQPATRTPLAILIVDDEPGIRRTLAICLETAGHRVVAVSNRADALAEVSRRSFDLAFVDLRLGVDAGMDLIPQLVAACPWLKIVVITAYASVETAVEAMRRGATDYLPKPFVPSQVLLVTQKVAEIRSLEQRLASAQDALDRTNPEADLSTASPAVQRAMNLAKEVATSNANILIRGESGTGKSLLARAIHGWSPRAGKPFGVVSCPSLSAELLESELFGHIRGAFTGAMRDNPGRLAACDGGTLMLDEIGDLPLRIQPKLLRVLQERQYERVGDTVTRSADVRIIAATNVDLEKAVRDGRFREDLFYRLNVIQIEMPPLRERGEDIVMLAERLLTFFARQNHRMLLGFTKEALEALRRHSWPGNIRELRNVVERAAILCREERVGIDHLPASLGLCLAGAVDVGDMVSLETLEEQHIRRVLAATKTLDEAASVLGIDTATLWRRRKKYGV